MIPALYKFNMSSFYNLSLTFIIRNRDLSQTYSGSELFGTNIYINSSHWIDW